nr:hypothetical protein CFP56_71906 [Quercus suber]
MAAIGWISQRVRIWVPLFSARKSPTEKDLRCCLDDGCGEAGVVMVVVFVVAVPAAAATCSSERGFMMVTKGKRITAKSKSWVGLTFLRSNELVTIRLHNSSAVWKEHPHALADAVSPGFERLLLLRLGFQAELHCWHTPILSRRRHVRACVLQYAAWNKLFLLFSSDTAKRGFAGPFVDATTRQSGRAHGFAVHWRSNTDLGNRDEVMTSSGEATPAR